MIEIYSEDMKKVIGFAIRRYRLKFPDDTSREDIEQEVAIGLLKVPHDITAGDIIRHTIWSRVRFWKDAMSRQRHLLYDTKGKLCSSEPLYARESVNKILGVIELTEQERDFLKFKADGLDSREIMSIMGLNNRQRLEQIKRVAFFKVRQLCPTAEYWNEQAVLGTT